MYNLQFNKINATLQVEVSNKHLFIYNFNMYNLQFIPIAIGGTIYNLIK